MAGHLVIGNRQRRTSLRLRPTPRAGIKPTRPPGVGTIIQSTSSPGSSVAVIAAAIAFDPPGECILERGRYVHTGDVGGLLESPDQIGRD